MAEPAVPKQSPATLQQTYARWQIRHANATRAGLDTAPVEALYRQDWAKVAAGGTPMTAEEVSASLNAAYGHPMVTKHRGGGLLGTLENIPSDIGGILWNTVPAAAKFVHHLPSETERTLQFLEHGVGPNTQERSDWLAAHGYEPYTEGGLGRVGAILRNIAKTPLLPLIPGVSTAAGLTTPQGRAGLERHPIGALLDVAPVVGQAAELGVLGAGAKEAATVGNVAEQADRLMKAGRADLADQLAQAHGFNNYEHLNQTVTGGQRAASALAAGRPVKALVRAVPQLSIARLQLLDHFHLAPRASGARRIVSGHQTVMARQLDQHARSSLLPLIEDPEKGRLTEEDIARIGQLAPRPDLWPTASAEDQAVLTRMQSYVDARTASDLAQTDLLYKATLSNGKEVIYGGEQATRFQAVQRRLDARVGKMTTAQDNLTRAEESGDQAAIRKARAEVAKAGDKLHATDQEMQKLLAKTVPAKFQPLVESQIKTKVQAWLADQHVAQEDPRFVSAMEAFDRGQPLAEYLPEKVLATITREVTKTWQDLAETYNPIWVPTMSSEVLEQGLRAPRFRGRPKTPSSWKASYINRSAGSSNFVLAFGQDFANKLKYEHDQQIVNDFIRPRARSTSEVDLEMAAEYEKLRRQHPTWAKSELQNAARTKAYRKLDSSLNLGTQPAMQKLYKEDLWVPKDMADAIEKSLASPTDNELRRINMGTIRLYKHAVMDFSPTHKAHIWLGSMLPMMLGAGVEEFHPQRILDAWHMARGAKTGTMPDLLNQHLALTATDDLMEYAHGLTIGRLWKALGNFVERSRKIDELGANMYRSWAYLSEEARQLRKGVDPETAAAMGIAYANKAFVDVGNLTPIEQVVAKNIFPFYSYTRWALTFIMQYPIDHPVRASILAHLGEQEKAYNDSKGIPNTLAMLFHLGKPDSKGDQWGVQYRAFNPFRDTASNFTLAGIFKNLGPAGRVLATAAGVNTLSGTPDPYPGLDIDPNTGTLVGTVRGKSPLAEAEQVVPELGILDHYLGLSQQARSLRTSDPQAFRRQVFSILNMPFVPQAYTPYTAAATRARDQLRVAQATVSAAVKNQDLGALDIYDQVPVPSKLRPYFGNQEYVATAQFKRVVSLIYEWEKRTGQKII